MGTQREIFKYIGLELRTFVLKKPCEYNCAQCSQFQNKMVRREKLNWVY